MAFGEPLTRKEAADLYLGRRVGASAGVVGGALRGRDRLNALEDDILSLKVDVTPIEQGGGGAFVHPFFFKTQLDQLYRRHGVKPGKGFDLDYKLYQDLYKERTAAERSRKGAERLFPDRPVPNATPLEAVGLARFSGPESFTEGLSFAPDELTEREQGIRDIQERLRAEEQAEVIAPVEAFNEQQGRVRGFAENLTPAQQFEMSQHFEQAEENRRRFWAEFALGQEEAAQEAAAAEEERKRKAAEEERKEREITLKERAQRFKQGQPPTATSGIGKMIADRDALRKRQPDHPDLPLMDRLISLEEAKRQAAITGQELTVTTGPDGTTTFRQGPAAGGERALGKTTPANRTAVQREVYETGEQLTKLREAAEFFDPEFLTLPGRFRVSAIGIREWLGVGDPPTPGEQRYLGDFTEFVVANLDNVNRYIQSVTGAAMSIQEANRIRGVMPDPGDPGLWNAIFNRGDTITEYKRKYLSAMRRLKIANARARYLLTQGYSRADVEAFANADRLEEVSGISLNANAEDLPDAMLEMLTQ